jgi:hypothetical protein
MGNKLLRRVAFINRFLLHLQDDQSIVFVIDEVGFGTNPLRRYAYSKIG